MFIPNYRSRTVSSPIGSRVPTFLSDAELKPFRDEYLGIERSIERYVSVYLSALAVAAAWLIGPNSVEPQKIVSGNSGYNVYVLLCLSLVNLVFISFVLFKGLQIHELMQFATNYAERKSVVTLWEEWRRHKVSLTKRIRVPHYMITSGFPVIVGLGLLGLLGAAVFRAPHWLVADKTRNIVAGARVLWSFVVTAHLIVLPVYIWLNSRAANTRWAIIQSSLQPMTPEDIGERLGHDAGSSTWPAQGASDSRSRGAEPPSK